MDNINHLRIAVRSSTGVITLDRQESLNAMSLDMCKNIIGVMGEWASDPGIDRVMIMAAPGRAFSAGGDIRSMVLIMRDDPAAAENYFRTEYTLHALVNIFPKPVVVLADGLTMGGGAGMLLNASHPVITTAMDFAMPETAIGLFPDAGASLFLRRAPSAVAAFLGMTGWRIGAGDMLHFGIAPLGVDSGQVAAVADAVVHAPDAAAIGPVLEVFRLSPPDTVLAGEAEWIERRFNGADAVSIRAGLEDDEHPLAEKSRNALDSRCPLSIEVTRRLLTDPSLEPANAVASLKQDFRLASRMIRHPDYAEGVRALLIDKDNNPAWQPATREGVTPAMVEAIVTPEGFDRPDLETPMAAA